jgi:hypothetical protein
MTPKSTYEALQRYQPDGLSTMHWGQARDAAVDAVMATGETSYHRSLNRLSALAKFLAWHPSWERSGAPDLAALLTASHLDSFVSGVNAHRATRTHLRQIARALGTMEFTTPIPSQRVSPVAEAFWTKGVGLGPLSALVAAYRREGYSFALTVFGGIVERLALPEWDLVELVARRAGASSPLAVNDVVLAALRVAAIALLEARDVVPTRVVRPVRRTSTPATPAKPLSRTAIVRSAKAFQAAREAAAAQRASGEVVEPTLAVLPALDEVVAAAIEEFRPYLMSEEEWALVSEATRHLAHAYEPPSVRWIEIRMGLLARFCLWALNRPQRPTSTTPLLLVELLEDGLVDQYLAGPLAASPDATRATTRSVLRRGVRRLAPDLASPIIAYEPVQAPYTPKECAAYVRLARNQPTSVSRRGVSSIVALGLGAGLSAQEQRTVAPSSIVEVDLGGGVVALFVRVDGSRARTVVVREPYEELLREALALHRGEGRGEDQPLYGGSPTRGNVTTPVTWKAKTALGTGIELSAARLRSTWLVACMSAPVPLGALLRASGLRSARTLVDLVGYCPEPDEAAVIVALRAVDEANNTEVGE